MKRNKGKISVLLIGVLMCVSVATAGFALAEPSPDVYDYASLFTYSNASGGWGSNNGIIHNNALWGSNSFKITSDGTGSAADGSSAKMNAAFNDYVEFTLNPIPKAGAATASDYAFRVLRVRIANAADSTDYFDFVINNLHPWVSAPSIFPNTDSTEQGALNFIEYKGFKTGDTLGTEVPNWSFGKPMQGGFCGTTRVTSNVNFKYDVKANALTFQDGNAGGTKYTLNAATLNGKTFDADYFTVEFIFDKVQEGEKAGIAIANIKSQFYADMWTNTEGSKTSGSAPVITSSPNLGELGDFGEYSENKATEIDFAVTDKITAIDFETGYYNLSLSDSKVKLGYRKVGITSVTDITAIPFTAPTEYGDYEIVAAVNDGFDVSAYSKIATFSIPSDLNIKLIGDALITVEVSGTITDPGATVTSVQEPKPEYTSDFNLVDFDTVGDYTVTYTVSDTSGNTATATRVIKVVDTTAPVITLNGSSKIVLDLNSAFTDDGATATDNYDDTVTVSVSGNVDTTKIGNYKLTYTATDANNNSSVKTREVYVAKAMDSAVYNYSGLFDYNNASGEWGSIQNSVAGNDFGVTGFNIVSDGTGSAANGSGAKLKGVFTDSVEFTINPIPKANAATNSDYAFRVLRVRFADALNPDIFFDYVIHNKHSWLPAPSIFPNSPPTTQGALSYIEFGGVQKSNGDAANSGGMVIPNLPFGGAMGGGFCGNERVTNNMRFKYDLPNNKIVYFNGTANQDLVTLNYDTFGKDFNVKYFTVEFMFEEVQPNEKAGISLAKISSQYGDMITEHRGSKTDGVAPVIIDDVILGNLGQFKPDAAIAISGNDKIKAYDFESGLYDLSLTDSKLKYYYRLKDNVGAYIAVTDNTFNAPDTDGEYQLYAEITDVGGNLSGKSLIGSFTVSSVVAPIVVTISGDYEIVIEVHGSWTDLGATALDEDGNSYPVTSNFNLVDFSVVDDYVVTYSSIDTNNNDTVVTATRIIRVVDTTAPVLSLKGDSEMSVNIGGQFGDPGFDVSDNYDENINVVVTGSVDTSVMGEYTLTYTATDANGNTVTLTRTVRVSDNIQPVITLGDKVTGGKVGSTVSVAYVTVTDNSGETPSYVVSVTFSDGSIVDYNKTENTFKLDKEGVYTVTITATDSAGNTETVTYDVESNKGGNCGGGAELMLLMPLGAMMFIKRKRAI